MTDNTTTGTTKPASLKPARAKRFARQPVGDGAPTAVTPPPDAEEGTAAPPKVGKTERVLALLRREEGATLAEITEATGWLPHSTRAALTGLRKKGHAIEKTRRADVTCYAVKAPA